MVTSRSHGMRLALCLSIFHSVEALPSLQAAAALPNSRSFDTLTHMVGIDTADESAPIDQDVQGCFGETEAETALADGTFTFGINPTYNKELKCKWKFPAIDTDYIIAFSTLDLEPIRDVIQMKTKPETGVAGLSGQYLLPRIFKFDAATAPVVVYSAREELKNESRTMPLAFTATIIAGGCFNNCGGHGSCDGLQCVCEQDWSGMDCTTFAPRIAFDVEQPINNVKPSKESIYFSFEIEEQSNVLIEFIDDGHVHSKPFLMLGYTPPSGNIGSHLAEDLTNHFADNSDIHLIPANLLPGIYYIGISNRDRRPEHYLDQDTNPHLLGGALTVRMGGAEEKPCVAACFGNGACDTTTGQCICDEGFVGQLTTGARTCEYAIQPFTADATVDSTLRIGDWDYYSIEVTEQQALSGRTLMFHFNSLSSEAHGIMVLKKGSPPSLQTGFMPTYGSFDKDFGDLSGFSSNRGKEQTIMVSGENLTAGTYYLGVYNLWGNLGVTHTSEDTLHYSLFGDVFSAGVPCPMANMLFCDGNPCDFNTGKCQCPRSMVGESCTLPAKELTPGGEPLTGTLAPGDEAIFFIEIGEDVRDLNLRIMMEQPLDNFARPYLIAKKGETPFLNDKELHDEHDLQAFFHGMASHYLTIDRHELSAGMWYIKLVNTELVDEVLEYSVAAGLAAELLCPTTTADSCSGHGECQKSTGRCICDAGWTMDTCEAKGVEPWEEEWNSQPALMPRLDIGGWAFWSVPLGCEGLGLDVTVNVTEMTSAPKLVIRRDQLPLQVEAGSHFYDYFASITHERHVQRIVVDECDEYAESDKCNNVIRATKQKEEVNAPPGTVWATGVPTPGIYYIGLFNDYQTGTDAMESYTLDIKVTGSCNAPCKEGFMGPKCDQVCPGVAPLSHYTNSPMETAPPCSSHGQCIDASAGGLSCLCDKGFLGAGCELACPTTANGVCGGQGACSLDEDMVPTCTCAAGFTGQDCSLKCPAGCDKTHGACNAMATDKGDQRAVCVCSEGFKGSDCTQSCPVAALTGEVCSGYDCVLVTGVDRQVAECRCPPGKAGEACDKEAITVATSGTKGPVATPLPGWVVPMSVIGGLLVAALTCLAVYLCVVAAAQRKKLMGYQKPMEEGCEEEVVNINRRTTMDGDKLRLSDSKNPFDSPQSRPLTTPEGNVRRKPRAESTDVDEDSYSPEPVSLDRLEGLDEDERYA